MGAAAARRLVQDGYKVRSFHPREKARLSPRSLAASA